VDQARLALAELHEAKGCSEPAVALMVVYLYSLTEDGRSFEDGFVMAADPPRGNADGERVDEGSPPLPAITGGILCSSNGPLQNPTSKALPIKTKPTTKHHKTKEARNRELIDKGPACQR
jgi:hypothetical protein